MVSWFECIEFCNQLSVAHKLVPCYSIDNKNIICNFNHNGYRLPTEAEWECAARGGLTKSDFPYAGSHRILDVAWYKANSKGQLQKVGLKVPNQLGLYDMSGNIWEWCWDWYGPYSGEVQNNPTGPQIGTLKVYRGGSFLDFDYGCTVSVRGKRKPNLRQIDIGFRIVRTASFDWFVSMLYYQ